MKKMTIIMLVAMALSASAQDADTLRVFYFGNSLTGSTAPKLHEPLGATAGKTWKSDIMAVAGGQVWQYMMQFREGAGLEAVGEYTLDELYAAKGPYSANKFLKGEWDVIVIQPFATHMVDVCKEKWGNKWDREYDLGDIAASKYLIDLFLKKNPKGRVLIYQDWPGMPNYSAVRNGNNLRNIRWELNHDQMHNIRRSMDWEKVWKRQYNTNEPPWDCAAQSQSYEWLLMDKLKEAYPALWKEDRLVMIPVGDVYNILHRKALADRIPGIYSAGQFYCDGLHHRAGMPAYTCAATFYAMLFKDHPEHLDSAVYNDGEAYGNDEHNDRGVVLEITPERAKIIHDTIWDVIHAHPYTRMSDKGSVKAYEKLEASIDAPELQRVMVAHDDSFRSWLPPWQMVFSRSGGKWLAVDSRRADLGLRRLLQSVEEKPEQFAHDILSPWYDVLCLTPGRGAELVENPRDAENTELHAAVKLAKMYLEKRPDGRLAFFFGWPALAESWRLRKELNLQDWEPLPEEKLAELKQNFDFTAAWSVGEIRNTTAAGVQAFTEAILASLPDMKDRMTVISVGDVFAAMDAKLKAGALPGTASMADFYKDERVLRTGLPRYAVAAVAHAALTGGDPAELDGEIYNVPEQYAPDAMDPKIKIDRKKDGPTIPPGAVDNGPHFPITPEGKRLVDETIKELVLNRE